MKLRKIFIIWVFVAFLSAFSAPAAEKPTATNDDQVVASFEREFNHEAPQPKPSTRDDVDSDILYERISKPLRTPNSGIDADDEASS